MRHKIEKPNYCSNLESNSVLHILIKKLCIELCESCFITTLLFHNFRNQVQNENLDSIFWNTFCLYQKMENATGSWSLWLRTSSNFIRFRTKINSEMCLKVALSDLITALNEESFIFWALNKTSNYGIEEFFFTCWYATTNSLEFFGTTFQLLRTKSLPIIICSPYLLEVEGGSRIKNIQGLFVLIGFSHHPSSLPVHQHLSHRDFSSTKTYVQHFFRWQTWHFWVFGRL